jgi:hypothetical protein
LHVFDILTNGTNPRRYQVHSRMSILDFVVYVGN